MKKYICKSNIYVLFSSVFLLVGLGGTAEAIDTIILDKPLSGLDRRTNYTTLLLKEVLKRTEREFGPFKIQTATVAMERRRLLEELKRGELVNVSAQPSQPSWESDLKAIKIPVDMGLQSWRIALIDQKKQPILQKTTSSQNLKKLRLGIGTGWSTYSIFKAANFNLVPGSNYDGLFEMLMVGRSDYFLRGINEVFVEYDDRKTNKPSLAVEQSLLVHVPLPWLFFTSPKTPRIAERIHTGMEAMLKDGSLQAFMLAHNKEMLKRAQICHRHIIEVPNNDIPQDLLSRKDVWFDPLDPKNGICKSR